MRKTERIGDEKDNESLKSNRSYIQSSSKGIDYYASFSSIYMKSTDRRHVKANDAHYLTEGWILPVIPRSTKSYTERRISR